MSMTTVYGICCSELSTAVDAKETDLFTLMQQVETGKMHAMCGYPYLQPFLNRAQAENVNEALDGGRRAKTADGRGL